MSPPTHTKAIILQNEPVTDLELAFGLPTSTFAIQEQPLPSLREGQILVKVLYLADDPVQRVWMQKGADAARVRVPPIRAGDVVTSFGLGRVLASKADNIAIGQTVVGVVGWREYAVVDAQSVRLVETAPGLSPTLHMGILGNSGLTAWAGLVETGKFQKEQSLVVSGAAGSVGYIVVQMAKHILGASKVVAIAGSEEKCKWLRSIGADVTVNYKSPKFQEELDAATEGYVDAFFDNTGGTVLNAMLPRIKQHGTIISCGTISNFHGNNPGAAITNWHEIPTNGLSVLGFTIIDHFGSFPQSNAMLEAALAEGKIRSEETLEKAASLEDVPRIWNKLFEGGNIYMK